MLIGRSALGGSAVVVATWRPASRSARPMPVPSGAVSCARPRARAARPPGRSSPPAMIPIVGADDERRRRRRPPPRPTAATISRRPVIRPTASPTIAAGKMTSIPNRFGSTIASPTSHARQRREVPRDQRRDDGGDTSSRHMSDRPSRRKWAIDSANDSSVRRWAAAARSDEGPAAEPRRQRRRVEEVAGVEERGQQRRWPARRGRWRRSRRRRTGPPRRTR